MTENTEITFLKIYKNSIQEFNRLDRNMAYCLRYCSSQSQECLGTDKLFKMTFDRKTKKILNIAKGKIPPEEMDDFSKRIEKCRLWRNLIVHGELEWKGWLTPPIFYHLPEPFNQKGSISVKDFQRKLFYLEKTSLLFSKVRQKLEMK